MFARVDQIIQKKDTFWRKALDSELKLAINLGFLATGDSYKSLMSGLRVTPNTICNFIGPVCWASIAEYAEELIKCPVTAEEWKKDRIYLTVLEP